MSERFEMFEGGDDMRSFEVFFWLCRCVGGMTGMAGVFARWLDFGTRTKLMIYIPLKTLQTFEQFQPL